MTMIVTAVLFSLALAVLAQRANTRLRSEDRLPMQWSLGGDVTWSAPRAVALAVIPALAILVFVYLIVLSRTVPSRPGQEGMVLPTLIGIGLVFVAIQLLHFWLIGKTLSRGSR